MKLIKCPRCELNYMYENEVMCSVCRKDVKGEKEADEMIELCSECGENPVIPGQEVCAFCLKEIQRRAENSIAEDDGTDPSSRDLDIDSVSSMEEIEMNVNDEEARTFGADELFDDEDEEEEEEETTDDEDEDDDFKNDYDEV